MELNTRQQLEHARKNGAMVFNDGRSEFFGFWDWFCSDKALEGKSKVLVPKVEKFVKRYEIDAESTYVFFKNNLTGSGMMYDDFRICDSSTGEVLFTVIPKYPYSGNAEVYAKSNGFKSPLISAPTFTELLKLDMGSNKIEKKND